MKLEELYRIRLELSGVKPNKMEDKEMENPCWEGYEPIGLKDDGSPNCVPIKEQQSKVKEGFPIPSPGGESEEEYISKCISEIIGEYPEEGQAYAICKGEWDK
jgi:hypothetical protein